MTETDAATLAAQAAEQRAQAVAKLNEALVILGNSIEQTRRKSIAITHIQTAVLWLEETAF